MPLFGERLEQAINRAGMTKADFARRAKTTSSVVSDVIAGRRGPPKTKIALWASVLAPKSADAEAHQEFVRYALLAHAPRPIQQWVLEMVERKSPTAP